MVVDGGPGQLPAVGQAAQPLDHLGRTGHGRGGGPQAGLAQREQHEEVLGRRVQGERAHRVLARARARYAVQVGVLGCEDLEVRAVADRGQQHPGELERYGCAEPPGCDLDVLARAFEVLDDVGGGGAEVGEPPVVLGRRELARPARHALVVERDVGGPAGGAASELRALAWAQTQQPGTFGGVARPERGALGQLHDDRVHGVTAPSGGRTCDVHAASYASRRRPVTPGDRVGASVAGAVSGDGRQHRRDDPVQSACEHRLGVDGGAALGQDPGALGYSPLVAAPYR